MKDIPNFEGLYSATETGQIWSHYKNRFLTPTKSKNGYLKVILIKNKIPYNKMVHRLIAETFLPNPLNYPMVNHKDENKANNKVENLEWCDARYNANYGTNPTRLRERMKTFLKEHPDFNRGKNNPSAIPIKCIETQEIFDTFTQAIQWCGLASTACLTDYFNGKQKTAGKHPITKQKLHWEKYENNQWVSAKPYPSRKLLTKNYKTQSVKCIETGEIFDSITIAQNKYNIKHIGECCSGNRKTAGGKHWEYVQKNET